MVRLMQFQCQKEGTLFYYQHEERQCAYLVSHCPVCGSKRVKATGREYAPVDETAGVTD